MLKRLLAQRLLCLSAIWRWTGSVQSNLKAFFSGNSCLRLQTRLTSESEPKEKIGTAKPKQ